MQPTVMNANRPPFARFELREVEDRAKSLENGYYTTKSVVFALITPSGSRDVVEKIATEWLEQLQQFVQEERVPATWLDYYRDQHRRFVQGLEPELNGTDIRNWAVASPSQQRQMREIGIRTVEDLANANEEALARLGMGARHLKAQAIVWVENSSGKAVEAAKAAEDAQKRVSELEAQIAELRAAQAAKTETAKPQPDPAAPAAPAEAKKL